MVFSTENTGISTGFCGKSDAESGAEGSLW